MSRNIASRKGWIRVQAGRTLDRKGKPLTLKLSGPVEAWFEDGKSAAGEPEDTQAD